MQLTQLVRRLLAKLQPPEIPQLRPTSAANRDDSLAFVRAAMQLALLQYNGAEVRRWLGAHRQNADKVAVQMAAAGIGIALAVMLAAIVTFFTGNYSAAIMSLIEMSLIVLSLIAFGVLAVRCKTVTFGPTDDVTQIERLRGLPDSMRVEISSMSQQWRNAGGFPLTFVVQYLKRPFREEKLAWVLSMYGMASNDGIVTSVSPLPQRIHV